MSSLAELASRPEVFLPWLRLLLDTALKAGLLVALVGVGLWLWRRNSAADRSYVWAFVISAVLLLPILSFLLPAWKVPVLPAAATVLSPYSDLEVGPDRAAADVSEGISEASPIPAVSSSKQVPSGWYRGALIAWAFGAAVVLTWFVIGRGTVWWIRRHAEPLIAEDWIELTGMVSAEVGIGRKVTFLKSPSTAVAIADGIRKASVILPACSEGWDRERRRVVLLHELTHIRRMDGLFELIAQAALILQWFNPLVWVAVRQHKRERERACDDAVLISGTKPSTYAYHLMEVAKDMSMNRTGLLRAATVSQATSLKDRLLCILNPGLDRNPQGRTRAAAAAVAILVTVVPLAAVQPWPAHRQQSEIENPISNKSFRNNQAPGPGSSLSKLAKILPPLADDDGEAHRQAAEALRSMNSEEVIAALIDALDDDSADVRRQAIVALEHLRAKRAVPHLIEALRDKDGSVRKHAAIALEHIPTVDAVPALVDALADMEPEVRHASVVALEHIRSRDAVPALIGALSDPHPEVRRSAAYALEKIRDRRALAALAHTMANDSDSRVRQAAAHALGRIK